MRYAVGMKPQNERPDLSEMSPYRLGRHWNTIQACLVPDIEDDIGELSGELKQFMGICELLIDDKMFARDDMDSKTLPRTWRQAGNTSKLRCPAFFREHQAISLPRRRLSQTLRGRSLVAY